MEKWDAYGPRREKLGYELLRGQPLPRGVRHLVAHMLYYNGKGQVLLQRRSESRPLAPGYRATADLTGEKIGKKIRLAQMEKIPYMLVVGDRDMAEQTVSVRHRAEGDLGAMSFDAFAALLKDVVDSKARK